MASWATVVKNVKFAKKVYGRYKKMRDFEAKAVKFLEKHRTSKKGDVDVSDLRPFFPASRDVPKVINALKEGEKQITALNKSSPRWPQSDFTSEWMKIMRLAKKYGEKSRKVEEAVMKLHLLVLRNFQAIERLESTLVAEIERLERMKRQAGAVRDHAGAGRVAFETMAKAPWMGGTGKNAYFFSLSEGCFEISNKATFLRGLISRALSDARRYRRTCAARKEAIHSWLVFFQGGSGKKKRKAA